MGGGVMIESLALKLFSYIKQNKTLSYEDEIYIYGLEILVSTVWDTLIILAISLLLGQFIEAFVFLAVFSVLRLFTGGYHSNTYWGCTAVLTITYLVYECLIKLIQPYYSLPCLFLLWSLSLFVIIKYSPIDNENKPLNTDEKKRFKKKSIVASVLLFAFSTVMFFILNFLSLAVTVTVFGVIILMAIKIFRKGGKTYEKD